MCCWPWFISFQAFKAKSFHPISWKENSTFRCLPFPTSVLDYCWTCHVLLHNNSAICCCCETIFQINIWSFRYWILAYRLFHLHYQVWILKNSRFKVSLVEFFRQLSAWQQIWLAWISLFYPSAVYLAWLAMLFLLSLRQYRHGLV